MNKIIYKLAVFAVLTSCINTTAVAATGPQRTLVGYADPLTVRPGDTVKFMVSSFKGDYTADLVQVINGDKQSRYAKMFEVKPVKAAFAGQYKGSEQPLNLGSYIHVEKTPALDKLKSFTISAWIYPTFNPVEYKEPDLDNIDPFSPPTLNIGASVKNQTIISRFDQTKQIGWALELDEKFRLRFVTGNGPGQVKSVQITEPTRDWDWTYVAASYDAAKGVVKVSLREKPFAPGDQFIARNLSADGHVDKFKHQGPLRIAAVRNGKGATNAKLEKPGHVFNGRIQDVRIVNRVLNAK